MSDNADKSDTHAAKNGITFHPEYNDEESDLVLLSGDGQSFRVHSIILKLASSMFKTMIEAGPEKVWQEPIQIHESAVIVKILLDIICPNKLENLSDSLAIHTLKDVCIAAEKYNMSAVLDSLRRHLRLTIHKHHPLSAFALASQYGWEEEQRLISTATLSLNLYSFGLRPYLRSIPTSNVMKLMELHKTRRDALVGSVNLTVDLSSCPIQWSEIISISHFSTARKARPQRHIKASTWAVLQFQLLQEMERLPDGSSIRLQKFWDQSNFNPIWEILCPNPGCGCDDWIDKHKLKDEVIKVLDNLPKTITSSDWGADFATIG